MFDLSHIIQHIIDFFSQSWIKEGIQAIITAFGKINLWFKEQFGYSFIEMLKLAGQAIIWALEKVLSLLKGIVK